MKNNSKYINPKEFMEANFIFDTPSPASEMRLKRKLRSPKQNKKYKTES